MRAMVLAAGLGTRLRPVTHTIPKCLAPIFNRPLISIILKHLAGCGAQAVVMNAHHLPEKILSFLEGSHPPVPVEVSHEKVLLDTGGGVKKVLDFFGKEPFFVMNGDVLTDFDPREVMKAHVEGGSLATMVLADIPGLNNVMIDPEGQILGFSPEEAQGERILAFTGLQVLNPRAFEYAPDVKVFSILDVYLGAIAGREKVSAHIAKSLFWAEVGSVSGLLDCHRRLARRGPFFPEKGMETFPVVVHPTAYVDPRAEISGFAAIGPGARVGDGAFLSDVVVLENTEVSSGETLSGCIAGPGFRQHEDG